jgi:hypothetical protein
MMTTEAPIALQTLHPQSNDTRPAQPTELALDDRHNKLSLTAFARSQPVLLSPIISDGTLILRI